MGVKFHEYRIVDWFAVSDAAAVLFNQGGAGYESISSTMLNRPKNFDNVPEFIFVEFANTSRRIIQKSLCIAFVLTWVVTTF